MSIAPKRKQPDSENSPPESNNVNNTETKVSTSSKLLQTPKFSLQMLEQYYRYLFPTSLVFRWLSYGDNAYMRRREFTFWKDDRPTRYLSYSTKEALKKDILKKMPEKIDFGGVFNASPAMKDSVKGFAAESKELVFDIDMTDYDTVRSCCSGAAICHKCWDLMTCAVLVLDAALRHDFGFEHLLWVFSGRRGIHCWIADERARNLAQEEREAIVHYLSVELGNERNHAVNVGYTSILHPSLKRAYDILLPRFEQFTIMDQGLLESQDSCDFFLSFLEEKERPYFQFPDEIMDANPEKKWHWFKNEITKHIRTKGKQATRSISQCLAKIVFYYTYPRLDVGVSKHLNHLLKSPFSVHPKTGNVCVPFLAEDCLTFDPFDGIPTLRKLVDEMYDCAQHDKKFPDSPEAQLSKLERSSLAPYVGMLEKFVLGLEHETAVNKKNSNAGVQSLEF